MYIQNALLSEEDQATVKDMRKRCTENFVTCGHTAFGKCKQTERQTETCTDKQTNTVITILHTPPEGGEILSVSDC